MNAAHFPEISAIAADLLTGSHKTVYRRFRSDKRLRGYLRNLPDCGSIIAAWIIVSALCMVITLLVTASLAAVAGAFFLCALGTRPIWRHVSAMEEMQHRVSMRWLAEWLEERLGRSPTPEEVSALYDRLDRAVEEPYLLLRDHLRARGKTRRDAAEDHQRSYA